MVADAEFSGGGGKLGKRIAEHVVEQLQPAARVDDEQQAELGDELGVELEAEQRHRTCRSTRSEKVGLVVEGRGVHDDREDVAAQVFENDVAEHPADGRHQSK